jgi:hypothetical protein
MFEYRFNRLKATGSAIMLITIVVICLINIATGRDPAVILDTLILAASLVVIGAIFVLAFIAIHDESVVLRTATLIGAIACAVALTLYFTSSPVPAEFIDKWGAELKTWPGWVSVVVFFVGTGCSLVAKQPRRRRSPARTRTSSET